MKSKATKKEIMQSYKKIINVGNGKLQSLLFNAEPTFYTSGKYGWNADIYDFGNIAIVDGPRSFGNIKLSWHTLEEINNAAAVYTKNKELSPDEINAGVEKVLNDFLYLYR